MKLKLSEIYANPFKEKLGSGLDEDTIQKLQSNLNELGMMGALPVVQINKKYHIVYGHHRVEALKREFGNDYQIEVELHKYNEDQLLRGMVIENLTQGSHPFKSEMNHLKLVRKYLLNLSTTRTGLGGRGITEKANGSIRDISHWLDKETGMVMKKSKIADILKIADNLDEEILEDVEKQSHAIGEKQDDSVGVKIASSLASIKNKQEQKQLRKAIRNSRESHQDVICKSITSYKNAPDDIKQQVLDGYIDIADIEHEIDKQQLIDEAEKRPVTVFIPNFNRRMKDFNKNVIKLEKQIEIFSEVFRSPEFKTKYNILKPKQKENLNFVIFNIRERIQNCQKEIEFFMEQLPDNVVLLEAK